MNRERFARHAPQIAFLDEPGGIPGPKIRTWGTREYFLLCPGGYPLEGEVAPRRPEVEDRGEEVAREQCDRGEDVGCGDGVS